MAGINVNHLTSMLAKLQPDSALQEYARRNKNDPYIVSLAASESNRRKELRSAAQAAQGMQQQPKVVDAAIAQMAPQPMPPQQRAPQPMPEDVGIGQLRAPNMQFGAEGGIMGYDEGYDEGGMTYGQEPVAMMADGGVVRYQVGGSIFDQLDQQKASQIAQLNAQLAGIEPKLRAAAVSGDPQAIQMYAQEAQAVRNQINAVREGAGNRVGVIDKLAAPAPSPTASENISGTDRRIQAGSLPNVPSISPPAKAAPKGTRNAAPRPGAGAGPAAAEPVARADTGPTDIDALQQKYFGSIDQEVGGLRNARAGLVAGIKDLTEKNLAATRADIEKRGDVYKGREERLSEQKKSLESMGDRNTGLALLQAGAAMMSTPGGLSAALGKGIQVGSERYVAGLDKIEAAKSKFAEARDRLDDLRINRDDMNTKDIRAAEKDARESELKGKELLYNGLVSDLGIKQKNVTAIFGAAADDIKTTRQIDAERANTLTREAGAFARTKLSTDAALQSPERMAYMAALEKTKTKENPKGDPAAAYQSIVAMKREPVSMEKLRGDWLDMAKKMQIQADYPNIKTFEDYVTVFGGGVGGGGGGGGDGLRVVGVRPAK